MKKLGLLLVLLFVTNCFATIHTVNLSGISFSPANITITQGDTVRWIKTGGFHNVADQSQPPVFRSGDPTSAPFTYDFAFAAPLQGLFNYECEVHAGSGMVGSVDVMAAGDPPGEPSNPIPLNNSTGMPLLGFVIWDAATNADHYIVRFGTTNPPPVVNNNFAPTMYPYQDLVEATQYFWRITAVNSFGQTDGPVWSFTTQVPLPSPASNPFPAHHASNVPVNTFLGWDPSDFAETYEVFFGTQEPLASIGTTAGTTLNLPGALDINTAYSWRIDVSNASGTTTGSTWTFTTHALPPQAENPSPPIGAFQVPVTTALEWNFMPNTTSYEVYLGTAEPLASIGTVTQNTITPASNLLNETTYLWRVNTINDVGTTVGATWTFTTAVGSAADDQSLPSSFKIGSAYPNPFNSNVQISLSISQEGSLSARIFDIGGREVATLANGRLSAGEHRLEWNAAGQSAGLYFLQVRGANVTQTQKLIYLP